MGIVQVPCCVIRGGTSKGIFINERELPASPERRDRLLLSLFGSPDVRQIDGLGGAEPLTSKLAIVAPSARPGIDVEFLSGEVGIRTGTVSFANMCGNMASGVGYFALSEGLVEPTEPLTEVRIFCRNNNRQLIARLPVTDGVPDVDGDCVIDGVPGSGAATTLELKDPGGAVTGHLLPTGRPLDTIRVQGGEFRYSLVDSAILYAFLDGRDLGVSAQELPDALDGSAAFHGLIETIREAIAEELNCKHLGDRQIPVRKLKIAVVMRPSYYTALNGKHVEETAMDVVARIVNTGKVHKAFAVSGAACLGSAAVIAGTIPAEYVRAKSSPASIRIGHPSGVMDLRVHFARSSEGCAIQGAEMVRTARILMKGTAFARL